MATTRTDRSFHRFQMQKRHLLLFYFEIKCDRKALLVLISVLEVEFLDDDLDVGPGDGGDELLESHQTVVVLIKQGKGLPAVALHQGFVSLGLK